MKTNENLHDILSFYDVDCQDPYYISSGNKILKFPNESFKMDYYAFCICLSGEMLLKIDDQKYKIEKNSFLISAPSTFVKFQKPSPNFKMKLLFFEKNFLLKNISNPFIIESLSLFEKRSYNIVKTDSENTKHLISLLFYLENKIKLKRKFTKDIIRNIIMNILLEVAEIIDLDKIPLDGDAEIEGKKDLYLKFIQLIQENIHHAKSVKYYANRLFVSNKYLIQIVGQASGKTPHQIINEALLNEAYFMLSNPTMRISEIAYTLKFNSTSSFGRFFKRYSSVSPSEYRAREDVIS